jgi:hypothetical protein
MVLHSVALGKFIHTEYLVLVNSEVPILTYFIFMLSTQLSLLLVIRNKWKDGNVLIAKKMQRSPTTTMILTMRRETHIENVLIQKLATGKS